MTIRLLFLYQRNEDGGAEQGMLSLLSLTTDME